MKVKLCEVKFHEYAELTPEMTSAQYSALARDIANNGQLEPIKIANDMSGRCFDGRHRVKALTELGEEYVEAVIINEAKTDSDIRQLVLSSEQRRHQTTTQKVIMAHYEQKKLKAKGENATDGDIASSFGINRRWLGAIRSIERMAGSVIVEILFDGGKIPLINANGYEVLTDSLGAIQSYYKNRNEEIAVKSKIVNEKTNLDSGDTEMIGDDFEILTAKYNERQLKYLVTLLNKYIN